MEACCSVTDHRGLFFHFKEKPLFWLPWRSRPYMEPASALPDQNPWQNPAAAGISLSCGARQQNLDTCASVRRLQRLSAGL